MFFFGLRLLLQANLFRAEATSLLGIAHLLVGWPANIILLIAGYLFGTWAVPASRSSSPGQSHCGKDNCGAFSQMMEHTAMQFPKVTGSNLQRKKLNPPQDF